MAPTADDLSVRGCVTGHGFALKTPAVYIGINYKGDSPRCNQISWLINQQFRKNAYDWWLTFQYNLLWHIDYTPNSFFTNIYPWLIISSNTPMLGYWIVKMIWGSFNSLIFNPIVDKWLHPLYMGMKLFIHSQTSTVQPLKFRTWWRRQMETFSA